MNNLPKGSFDETSHEKTLLTHNRIPLFIWLLLLILLSPVITRSQSVEYHVKASLIFKIAQYTEWNSTQNSEAFQIAVLGKSPFKGEFEKLASRFKIKGKSIKIRYIKDYKEAEGAQVLFICQTEKKNIQKTILAFQSKNILLISDSPDFSGEGVHFNFFTQNDETIHFEIDLEALKNSGLKPDLQLVSIGKIIH